MTDQTNQPVPAAKRSKYDENGDPIPKYQDGNVPEFEDIPLSRPIDINGAKVATLRMRQPLMLDQRIIAKSTGSDEDKEVRFMANLCDVTPEDILKLALRDFKKVQTQYFDFIG